jgi:mono/diheme cytochrome c family protein
MARLPVPGWAVPVALAAAGCALGCERPPSVDHLQEWTAADHDRAEEQSNAATGQQAAPPGKRDADAGAQTLVEITWQTACAPCHGPGGRGDGPNGRMVNAPDITREELQAKFTDEEIAAIIRTGRNRMPKFDLPEPVVQGLVARIRATRGR